MRGKIISAVLVAFALLGCQPEPVNAGIAINIKVSPEWKASIDSVELLFLKYQQYLADCASYEGDPDTAVMLPACPQTMVACTEERVTLSKDPGQEGKLIEVPIGTIVVLGIGLENGTPGPDDCAEVLVSSSNITEVTLDLQ